MAKDLIIGGASNYTWNELKYWVNSIKLSGFSGDVVLVATNMKKETIDKLTSEGIILELYGKKQENGDITEHSNGVPHVERFFYLWNYIKDRVEEYDYVITTDTRDVIFQLNPSDWLDDNLLAGQHSLVASSECMKYSDEPWNNANLYQAFGPYFHNHYKNMMIHNVGTIAGETEYVRDMLFMIFQMSINRPIPIVDQVVYNVLLQQKGLKDSVKFTDNDDAWAVQLGTTIESVKSGSGDLGTSIDNDPTKLILYSAKYTSEQPSLRDDGVIVNQKDIPFTIIHQYDRTHDWKEKIMKRYE